MNKKAVAIIIAVAAIAALAGLAAYRAGTFRPDAVTAGWQEFSDPARGVSFRYPADLGTKYIQPVDWPPKLAIQNGPFSCTEAGSEAARAGKTEKREIGGRTYCVTEESEGAAGSVYAMYAYAAPLGNGVAILTFSFRFPQCANYPEPQKGECEAERGPFGSRLDGAVDRIMRTVRLAR